MLEGGGQILRNACALSALLRLPIRIDRIRANRSRPGLAAQHLTGLRLIAQICGGSLSGDELQSSAVDLDPELPRCGAYVADTKTAGSCTLLLQAALPVLLFAHPDGNLAQSELELRGGTDVAMAPPIGYLQHVLLPMVQQHLRVRLQMGQLQRGFYPKGGGVVHFTVEARPQNQPLPAVDLRYRKPLAGIHLYAFATGRAPEGVEQRMVQEAARILQQQAPGVDVISEALREPAGARRGDGCGLTAVAVTEDGSRIGMSQMAQKGVVPEAVAASMALELLDVLESGAAVDDWMQDQLIIFMALASGTSFLSCREPTLHTRTAIAVAQRLTGARFRIHAPASESACRGAGTYMIECQGIGATRSGP